MCKLTKKQTPFVIVACGVCHVTGALCLLATVLLSLENHPTFGVLKERKKQKNL